MKTNLLIIATIFFVLSVMLWITGMISMSQVSSAIWEFNNAHRAISGSSGGGYLSYDGVWIFFETGTILFAAGILMIVWRKK